MIVIWSHDIEKVIEDFRTNNILQTIVYIHTTTNLFQSLCIFYKVNILMLYYIYSRLVCDRNSIKFSYITQYKNISFILTLKLKSLIYS